MRDQRRRIEPTRLDHRHQSPHPFFASGTKCGHDSVIADASRERVVRYLKFPGINTEAAQSSARPQTTQTALEGLLDSQCFNGHVRSAIRQFFYLGHKIEIFARKDQVAAETMPGIRIVSPASKSVVMQQKDQIVVQGIAKGAQPSWSAQVEVFTDRWYVAGPNVPIYPDGRFHQAVSLGGQGRQQCSHLIRARLFDDAGGQRATTLNYGIARANSDGSAPVCR